MELKNNVPPVEMGTGTVYPLGKYISDKDCAGCKQRSRCFAGEGIQITIRSINHLYTPDYKESWTLFVDPPDCKQLNSIFSRARISASLYTGNRKQINGKVVGSRILQQVELEVAEI